MGVGHTATITVPRFEPPSLGHAAEQCRTNQCTLQGPVVLTNEARTARTEAIVAFGAGGALAATAVALFFLSDAHSPRATPSAAITAGGWTVGIVGTF